MLNRWNQHQIVAISIAHQKSHTKILIIQSFSAILIHQNLLPFPSYYNNSQIAPQLMNQVEHLIIQALTTADNNTLRKQAENGIFALVHENPSNFFINCATIVSDQTKNQSVRQQTATVMKAVLSKRTQNNDYYWDTADQTSKQSVKSLLLNNLISPNVAVMRTGANVIAQIAAIEIVRGQWLDIIDLLAQNSIHEAFNIRRASITTLGFLCEELKNFKSNINITTCEQILGSLLFGLNSNGGLGEISLQALTESIPFLKGILQNPEYFHKTFEYVTALLNTEPQRVYQIMFEFAKYCYQQLDSYMASIVQFTMQHIRQRNEVAVLALQFWDTLGGEYSKIAENQAQRLGEQQGALRNYMEELQDVLLPEIMQAILILDKSDLDLIDLREVAVKALTTFVSCCGRTVVDKVTDGVSRVLGSSNPGERQASALIFSSLCYYKDFDYIEGCFTNGFPHLIRLIADHEALVRKNTLIGFGALSQTFPGVFLRYNDIYNFFFHLLGLSVEKDEETRILSLTVLINITDSLRDYPNCPIASQPDSILQKLVAIFTNNLSQTSYKQSNQKIIVVLLNLLMSTSKKQVLVMLANHLISLYSESANSNILDRQIVLAQIITIIHTCVLSLAKFPPQYGLKFQLYKLIQMHISIAGFQEEGINIISSLAITFKKDFLNDLSHFDKYWNVVMQGLQFVDQKPLFKASLNCIADIARSDANRISNKLDPVFKKLVSFMHGTHDREIKIDILNCFGDLAIGLKNYSQEYVKTLIDMCNQCFEAVYKFSQMQQEKEYAEQLKESLIDMYHCVVFAQNQKKQVNTYLADHFPLLCTFIVCSCDVRLKPTVDYLRMCLYVMFDSALFYSRSSYATMAKNIIHSEQVQSLVSKIRNYSANRKEVQDLLTFIDDKSIRK